MCGIFCFIDDKSFNREEIKYESYKCAHRGPDNTKDIFFHGKEYYLYLVFHRLSINGLNNKSDQPFIFNKKTLICNGEIYNYKELQKKYNISLISDSDCEIILHLYEIMSVEKFINELDGVFSFIIFDQEKYEIIVGHDPLGIRQLYWFHENNNICFASEMKSLCKFSKNIEFFPPGAFCIYDIINKKITLKKYYDFVYPSIKYNYDDIPLLIKKNLTSAVEKRLLSDRPIGCLLSGGLDSSVISAIVSKKVKNLRTFSIGLRGSPDLEKAKIVSDYLKTKHTSVEVSEKKMLEAIEKTIKQIESYDITTVRASVPMFLLSEYIRDNTDIKVVLSGEGSDEASGSYLYFHNAPNEKEFQDECIRLLKDVHCFDVLRGDKTTAGAGLEIRVPFFDKNFINFYMSIEPKYKVVTDSMEKYLLRKAFESDLPQEIVWRRKDGFSDGVSKSEKPWYEIINEYSQKNFNLNEENMYKMYYDKYYKDINNIPYLWMPKWINQTNPSGRLIL